MNKELDEAWITICHYNDEIIHDVGSEYVENPLKEELDIVNNALLELQSIKEAKPSEALEGLEKMVNLAYQVDDEFELLDDNFGLYYDKVKQYILKAQEQEKVLSIIKEKNVWVARLKGLIKKYNDLDALRIYNANMPSIDYQLTQQEFNSLKELLKDDEHKYD